MAKKRQIDLRFPTLGIDRSLSYRNQPPYTTPDCLNVRTQATLEQRERGGSRPALDIAISTELGGGAPVRTLEQIAMVESPTDTLVIGQTGFKHQAWDFTTATIPPGWAYGFSHVTGADDFDDECWGTDTDSMAQIIYTIPNLDVDKNVSLGIYIKPVNGTHNATYYLYWGASTGSVTGSNVSLKLDGDTYTFSAANGGFDSGFDSGFSIGGQISSASAGYAPPGWFMATFDKSGTASFTFRDIALGSFGTDPANYFGVGQQSLTPLGQTCVDAIELTWHSTVISASRRNRLFALSNGIGYIEDSANTMTAIDPDSGLTFNSDTQLCAIDYQQKLVIADSGRLFSGTTGRLAAILFNTFSDDDGTVWTGVTTDYVLTIVDSDFTQNAVQSVTITNADGGEFVLAYAGFSTTPLNFDASAATVEDALFVLPGIGGDGNVSVAGANGGPYTVTFVGVLAESTVAILTGDASALTDSGGGTPAVTIGLIQQGLSGTAIAGSYKISSVGSTTITLTTPPSVGSSISDITSIEYSIDRPAKLYDPKTDVLEILLADADKGTVPGDNPLVWVYRDRLCFAGAPSAPTSIYMSRMGDINDWNYGATDSAGAVAIVATADAGRVPEPIVAAVPHSDECVLIGCLQSWWILRGDPGFGGAVDNISYNVGIVGAKAWTRLPTGEVIWLGQDGLYTFPAGCHGKPTSLSAERIPEELKCLDPNNAVVNLEWSIRNRGLYIFVTRESGTAINYWLDWETQSYWKESYQSDHEPFSSVQHYSPTGDCDRVYLGGRDGKIRLFEPTSDVDDGGFTIPSHVVIGPFRIASNDYSEGTITSITGVTAETSGEVDWEIRASDSHEAVTLSSKTADASGIWDRKGLNYTQKPRVRGFAGTVKLINGQPKKWAMERISLMLKDGGRLRIRDDLTGGTAIDSETLTGLTNDADMLLTNDADTTLTNDEQV